MFRSSTLDSALTNLIIFFLMSLVPSGLDGVEPSRSELLQAQGWVNSNFSASGPGAPLPPFSFVYDGKSSREFLKTWQFKASAETRESGKRRQSFSCSDPASGLEVICEVTSYDAFPAAEWVLYFRNTGPRPTPILQDVKALDMALRTRGSEVVLHHALGSDSKPTDFSPVRKMIRRGGEVLLAPVGGRSSDTTAIPFFNLEAPATHDCQKPGLDAASRQAAICGGGVMIGLGWSGQWSASFIGAPGATQLKMGMERTHLKLLPGERIRTPRMLLLFWEGNDRLRGHNFLRSFLLAHHTPRPGGRMPVLPIAFNTFEQFQKGNLVTEKNQIEFASLIHAKQIPADAFVIDAGWFEGGWPYGVGNWFPHKAAFPSGLRPLSDAVHKMGMKFSAWFEPERVSEGTWLDAHHPEWILQEGKQLAWLKRKDKQKLLNLGNPEALRWLTDHLSDMITREGIDILRYDFNIESLDFWRNADAPDRQGMTEIRYIEGLYALWDELLKRHPDLLIDNCSAGGRRLDLETYSRSLPLWRTDFGGEPAAEQSINVGLSLYFPLHSVATINDKADPPDLYANRGIMSAGLVLMYDVRRPDFDAALTRRIIDEEKRISKFYYGDLYPLTPVTTDESDWMSYQCDRPDLREGMVMAFRRKLVLCNRETLKKLVRQGGASAPPSEHRPSVLRAFRL